MLTDPTQPNICSQAANAINHSAIGGAGLDLLLAGPLGEQCAVRASVVRRRHGPTSARASTLLSRRQKGQEFQR